MPAGCLAPPPTLRQPNPPASECIAAVATSSSAGSTYARTTSREQQGTGTVPKVQIRSGRFHPRRPASCEEPIVNQSFRNIGYFSLESIALVDSSDLGYSKVVGKATQMITLPLDERIRVSRRQSTSMSMPLAVHHRLDVLAELAGVVNASRAEIISMLIAETVLNAEQLEDRIIAYRKMTVGDVVPAQRGTSDGEADNVISLPARQPGRPPNRATG